MDDKFLSRIYLPSQGKTARELTRNSRKAIDGIRLPSSMFGVGNLFNYSQPAYGKVFQPPLAPESVASHVPT